ncbi:1941_t:CDS:2, partial [Gigaspora margarita]
MSEYINGSSHSDASTTITFVDEEDSTKLDPVIKQILSAQVHIAKTRRSYFQLFRFATKCELTIMFIGMIFAGVAGSAMDNKKKIRERYLRAILRQNIAYFDKLGPGEVTTRITSDTHLIQEDIGEKAIIVIQMSNIHYSDAGTIAEEAISTIRTVVAFGSQKKLSTLYDSFLKKARKSKKSLLDGIFLGVTSMVVNVLFAITIGSLSLITISPDLHVFSSAAGAGAKIFEAIDRIPPIDINSNSGNTPENVKAHIQLKITIVSLLLRFYNIISGEIFLDDKNISSLNLVWLRRQIGLVAGNVAYGLIGSVYENMDETKKREMIENACKMANAHDFIMNLPEKYETNVGKRGFLLSGGQKERIAIARAIIKDPKFLLLDEATSALDAQSEDIVQDALEKASKGRTTIVIAHRLSTIRNANKIIVLERGNIVEMGAHEEFIAKQGAYSKLVDAQNIQVSTPEILEDDDDAIYEDNLPGYISRTCLLNEVHLLKVGVEEDIEAAIIAFSQRGERLCHDASFWSLMFIAIAAGTLITNIIHGVIFGISGEKLSERIRPKSFISILRQDISFFDEKDNRNILQIIATMITCIIVAFVIGWKMTLVCLACIPLLVGSGALCIRMLSTFQKKTKKAYENSAKLACESVANIRTVASLTREEDLLKIYHNLLEKSVRQVFNNAFWPSI